MKHTQRTLTNLNTNYNIWLWSHINTQQGPWGLWNNSKLFLMNTKSHPNVLKCITRFTMWLNIIHWLLNAVFFIPIFINWYNTKCNFFFGQLSYAYVKSTECYLDSLGLSLDFELEISLNRENLDRFWKTNFSKVSL